MSSFVEEPHAAVCCDARGETMNLVAVESDGARTRSVERARERPEVTLDALQHVSASMRDALPRLDMPSRHPLLPEPPSNDSQAFATPLEPHAEEHSS